jgi:hypothetical protein
MSLFHNESCLHARLTQHHFAAPGIPRTFQILRATQSTPTAPASNGACSITLWNMRFILKAVHHNEKPLEPQPETITLPDPAMWIRKYQKWCFPSAKQRSLVSVIKSAALAAAAAPIILRALRDCEMRTSKWYRIKDNPSTTRCRM